MDKKRQDFGMKGHLNSRSEDQILTVDASHQQAPQAGNFDEESNIVVALRVRPMIQREINLGDFDIIRNEDQLLIVMDPVELAHAKENKLVSDVLHRSKEHQYAFDRIFTTETQEQIYNETCRSLIHPVLNGYNACMFAYGTTGTGKTYTMLGYHEVPGIMVLTIKDMFDTLQTHYKDREFSILVSYVEIYNETIRDLLVSSSGYLELRDDPVKGTAIVGVTEHKAESTEQIMNLLFQGNKRRTTEATNANQTSSRSHAVLQINVNSKAKTKNIKVETLCGKLSLIDLAGSERGTVTENRGIRLLEGAKINRSLLALANCINALGDKSKKGFFVPYRDSKLTRLLKDSLGGNSKTVMIANISPASSQIEETLNTLKYASRAKNIKVKVTSNKKVVSLHVAEYKNIINDLRQEIEELKAKMGDANHVYHPNQQPSKANAGQGLRQLANNYTTGRDTPILEEINEYEGKEPGRDKGHKSSSCSCGRVQDDSEMKIIQEQLFENFQSRIQIRRAIMELDEQNAANILEMRKKRAEILEWEKGDTPSSDKDSLDKGFLEGEKRRPLSALPKHIKANYEHIKTLRTSTYQNISTRNQMNSQLVENIEEAKKIKDSIAIRIKHSDKRAYLELIIKNHVLELQNIELEIQLKIQEKTIGDLKNIVGGQQKLLVENNIDQIANLPWEETQAFNDDGNDEDDPTHKSLRDYENEDIEIDDLVYDDNDEEEIPDSGSFEVHPDSKKKFVKEMAKRDKSSKPDERAKPGHRAKNLSKIEDMYGDKSGEKRTRNQSIGPVSSVGNFANANTDNPTDPANPNNISVLVNRRDDKLDKAGGRGSYRNPSPAPDKLLKKDEKYKGLNSAIKIYGGTKKEKPPVPRKM